MAEQLNYQINIGGNVYESLGAVKKALKESNAELLQAQSLYGEYSKEAKAAADKVATLRDAIRNANETANLFDPGKKFQTLTNALSAVAGGFAAVQGAIGLLGGESKELEKQLLRVQSALALSQGLSTIADSAKDFQRLTSDVANSNIVLKANAIANTATAATMKALGVAVETTSLSFKVLKTAIASTGILLAVVAIGELISAISTYTSAAEKAKIAQDKLNESITKSADAALEAEIASINRTSELLKAEAKLRGASAEEIIKIEQSSANLRIKARERYDKEVSTANLEAAEKNLKEIRKEQDGIKLAEIEGQIARKAAKAQADKDALDDKKKKTDEQKRLDQEEEQRRKAKDDRESAAQKVQIDAFRATLSQREQDILRAEDELEQKRSVLIQAGNFDFQRIEEENRIKIAEINAKYDQEALDKQKAIDEKKRDAAEKEVERKKEYEERKRQFELESQQLTEELQNRREQLLLNGLDVLGAIAGENEKIANTIFAIQKGLEIAKVISSASASIGQIIASTQAIPPILPPGVPNPAYVSAVALGAKRAAIVKVGAAAQVAAIAATSISRFKNGSGSVGGSVSGESATAPLSPQSATTNLSASTINAIGNSAIRAYVVETDITSNQKRIQAIKQRARFS